MARRDQKPRRRLLDRLFGRRAELEAPEAADLEADSSGDGLFWIRPEHADPPSRGGTGVASLHYPLVREQEMYATIDELIPEDMGTWLGVAEVVWEAEFEGVHPDPMIALRVDGRFLGNPTPITREDAKRAYDAGIRQTMVYAEKTAPAQRYACLGVSQAALEQRRETFHHNWPERIQEFVFDQRSTKLRLTKRYYAELDQVIARYGELAPCVLQVDEMTSGNYRGQPRIRAVVPGIGVVTEIGARYREQQPRFFQLAETRRWGRIWVRKVAETGRGDDFVGRLEIT